MKLLSRYPAAAVAAMSMLGLFACGASAKDVQEARTSGYNTDFAIVYSEALAAVTNIYPKLVDSPKRGVIQTAWHPMNMSQGGQMGATPQGGTAPGASQQTNAFGQTRQARTFFFIRFRVVVIGGRPWRVRLKGEASKWEEGSTPVPLRDADTPPWLAGRTDRLRVKIHERLKKHAVRLKTTVIDPDVAKKEDPIPTIEGLSKQVGKVVAKVKKAAEARRYQDLRALMSEQLLWSPGAPPSGDQALIMWQADPSLLVKLVATIDAGCQEMGDQVVCGKAGVTRIAKFAKVGGAWKLTEFVAID
ncbi:MAG: hypothetical protein KJO07_24085 [Deltaproteobacteria bacterium]|jgi:hypothetical protein|nr:hypothetical protein [Deltaproteobacteria bacterium]